MQDTIVIMEIRSLKDFIKKSDVNFRLKLPFLSETENIFYSNRIIKNLKTCGCYEGKIGAIISVIVFLIVDSVFETNFPFKHLAFNLMMFVFVGAIIGKLIGKLFSKIIVQRTVILLSNKEKN